MYIFWREPLWLLILLYPLFVMAWHYSRQRKQRQSYADAALLPWVQVNTKQWQHYLRPILWACFWLFIAIALAGPRLPLPENDTQTKPNKTIMVVVDVSPSMQTADILPNRLQRAELELYELLQQVHASRIGIIVYAARPHLLLPATSDMNAVRFYIEKLDTLVLPTLGSDPIAALRYAEKQLRNDTDSTPPLLPSLPSMLLWLTDGDMTLEQQTALKNRVQQLKQAALPLYILGIGTEDGEAIPVMADTNTNNNQNHNQHNQKKWLHYKGQIVRSRLNSRLLQQLSILSEGRYSSVKDDASDWHILYQQGMAKSFPSLTDKTPEQQWQELYAWALFPAMLLLFALVTLPRQLLATVMFSSLLVFHIQPANANTNNSTLTSGIDAYRSENYPQAIEHFSAAVFQAKNDTERARVLHNLGNSYFQQGNYKVAIQVFRDALTYRPKHQPTLNNLRLGEAVQTELERQLAAKKQQYERKNSDGNRFERMSNLLDGDQDSSKTWGESKNKRDKLTLPTLPISSVEMQRLIDNGLKRLAQSGESDFASWNKRQQSQQEALIVLQQINDKPALFWKRLFEIEEGFPAALETPKTLPGVKPW